MKAQNKLYWPKLLHASPRQGQFSHELGPSELQRQIIWEKPNVSEEHIAGQTI
jgi:hypothetical protein